MNEPNCPHCDKEIDADFISAMIDAHSIHDIQGAALICPFCGKGVSIDWQYMYSLGKYGNAK